MAQSSLARISALTSCMGESAFIQLHPDAHNALNMAVQAFPARSNLSRSQGASS
ncbi:hypothetical protein HS961_12170 [Comamonas piscis]|uniref:Uncharacterized protein n=1 Tax=Comamonas piscis TaxID=1562974 RepID=A0A7G5EHP6_9BURK|nr:hypothetical protein [Comamonas piscis]QMV73521.1 hypothetical protein HS961_12170 [Comamonas piscis]WSO31938.1 hypothetical protein VUJ63_12205 [Comamonas piscis]